MKDPWDEGAAYRGERKGYEVFIDGVSAFAEYNADLIEKNEVLPSFSNSFVRGLGKSSLRLDGVTKGFLKVKLSFFVGGDSVTKSMANVSALAKAMSRCVFFVENESFEYDAILEDVSCSYTGVCYFHKVEIDLTCVRRLPLVSYSIGASSSKEFYNDGDVESGLRLSFVPSSNVSTCLLMGITFTNLIANYQYVVDGINGAVTENGVNVFAKTDIIEFPKVQPGKNVFTKGNTPSTGSLCGDVKIEFYPTFTL